MKKGFTLIELLVVVLIIGILSSIALPQYQKAVERARTAEAQMNISALERGIDLYLLANDAPTENTYFIGKDANSALDIDLASTLTNSNDAPYMAASKNFQYEAYCYPTICSIFATRPQGNSDASFYLLSSKAPTDKQWSHSCHVKSDMGAKICKIFEKDEWEYVE